MEKDKPAFRVALFHRNRDVSLSVQFNFCDGVSAVLIFMKSMIYLKIISWSERQIQKRDTVGESEVGMPRRCALW